MRQKEANDAHPFDFSPQRFVRAGHVLRSVRSFSTFDDVVIVPGYSEVLPDSVDTSGVFARDIQLGRSTGLGRDGQGDRGADGSRHGAEGGIGVIHRNLSVADQAAEVQKVKRSQSGMITDPVTLPAVGQPARRRSVDAPLQVQRRAHHDPTGLLVGILTIATFVSVRDPISIDPGDFMTSEGLVTASVGTTLDEARATLQKHRIEKLPLVDDSGYLRGLITVKDILKRQEFRTAHATRRDVSPVQPPSASGRMSRSAPRRWPRWESTRSS